LVRGLAGIIFGLYAALPNPNPSQNDKLGYELPHDCGPQQYKQTLISPSEIINEIIYKDRLLIEFYKRGTFFHDNTDSSVIKWIDSGKFDSFMVYEIFGENSSPILSGHFDGKFIYIHREGDRDYCIATNGMPLSSIIREILEQIIR